VKPPADSSEKPPRFYRPELDGLRFFAFLGVYLCHTSLFGSAAQAVLPYSRELALWIVSLNRLGPLSVSLFFCLSSYLITKLLLMEQTTRGRALVGYFYLRRALRIWPLYFFFVLFLQLVNTPYNLPMSPGVLLAFLLFQGNWALAYLGFLPNCALILGSISVEEQFYLVWPWLFQKRVSTGARRGALFGMIALAWIVRLAMGIHFSGSDDIRFVNLKAMGFTGNSLFHLDVFAMGALLAEYENECRRRFQGRVWLLVGLGLILLVARYPQMSPISPAVALAQGAVAFGCALIVLQSWSTAWLTHPLLTWLGRITYGLYVYHLFVLRTIEYHYYAGRFPSPDNIPSTATSAWLALLGLLATVLVASVSFYLLERPALRLKGRFARVPSGKELE
jgi:peptidoglycan/LPS O-acetylase OafA/YrhL